MQSLTRQNASGMISTAVAVVMVKKMMLMTKMVTMLMAQALCLVEEKKLGEPATLNHSTRNPKALKKPETRNLSTDPMPTGTALPGRGDIYLRVSVDRLVKLVLSLRLGFAGTSPTPDPPTGPYALRLTSSPCWLVHGSLSMSLQLEVLGPQVTDLCRGFSGFQKKKPRYPKGPCTQIVDTLSLK